MILPQGVRGRSMEGLVSGTKRSVTVHERWASLEVDKVLDHEVLVIS